MQVINKKIIVIFICLSIISMFIFTKKDNKENINLKEEKINNKQIALYIEKDNNYEEYRETIFPKGYYLNEEESKCIDNSGNKIEIPIKIENNGITISSNKTVYCTLYLDKSIGLKIIEMQPKPNGLKIEKLRGEMYRFQGQQSEGIENYICFGTSESKECKEHPDKYMYRIIGIEESGRIKVIKKEALKEKFPWWKNYNEDISFFKSDIYKAINGDKFLTNNEYISNEWLNKISDNIWIYGDMLSNDILGAKQNGEGLYQIESGQKGTNWNEKVEQGTEKAQSHIVDYSSSPSNGKTIYFLKHENEKWSKTFESKVSLMYLHDYNYSISDDANCMINNNTYVGICNTGWLHISNNDSTISTAYEATMTRQGYFIYSDWFDAFYIATEGYINTTHFINKRFVRPVFYIKNNINLIDGKGTINEPFIIQ